MSSAHYLVVIRNERQRGGGVLPSLGKLGRARGVSGVLGEPEVDEVVDVLGNLAVELGRVLPVPRRVPLVRDRVRDRCGRRRALCQLTEDGVLEREPVDCSSVLLASCSRRPYFGSHPWWCGAPTMLWWDTHARTIAMAIGVLLLQL